MTQWLSTIVLYLVFLVVLLCSRRLSAAQTVPGSAPEARDMALVGFNDLQGRSAYQPIIQQQDGRFIAYIGHHGGSARNSLSGRMEPNGTSIVDVTDPQHPRYLHHVPGVASGTRRSRRRTNGAGLRRERFTKGRSCKDLLAPYCRQSGT